MVIIPFLLESPLFYVKGKYFGRVLESSTSISHTAQKIWPLLQVSALQRDKLEVSAVFALIIFASFWSMAQSALCFTVKLPKKEFSCIVCQFQDYCCLKGVTVLYSERSKSCLMGVCTTKPGVGKVNSYNNSMRQFLDNLEVTQMVNNFADIYESPKFRNFL